MRRRNSTDDTEAPVTPPKKQAPKRKFLFQVGPITMPKREQVASVWDAIENAIGIDATLELDGFLFKLCGPARAASPYASPPAAADDL